MQAPTSLAPTSLALTSMAPTSMAPTSLAISEPSRPVMATATLAARVQALEQRYREIAATRMAGVALCHPGLEVAAVDFEPEPSGAAALGALVTPWFMNLVWLPLPAAAEAQDLVSAAASTAKSAPLPVGASRKRAVGPEVFEFIGAHESGIGDFEACSLFSPMFEFADQAAAVETARAALRLLRAPVALPVSNPGPAAARPPQAADSLRLAASTNASRPGPAPAARPSAPETPARRAFLLGRRAR